MTGTRDKIRSLFLATIMVVSIFGMTVTFAGSAAAVNGSIQSSQDQDPTERTDGEWDAGLNSSGGPFWQGQRLVFQISPRANQKVQIRETDSTDDGEQVGTFVREVTLDGNGEKIISTENLEGKYVITRPGGAADDVYYINDAVPDSSQTFTDSDGTITTGSSAQTQSRIAQASFEVTSQDLSIGFQDAETEQGKTFLDVDSARSEFDLLVTADGLDDDAINTTFTDEVDPNIGTSGETGDISNLYDASDGTNYGEGVVMEGVSSDANISANFSQVDTGDYEFNFEVVDTGASDDSSVSVVEPDDINAEIEGGVAAVGQGDVAQMTVNLENTDEARVNVGFNNVNYNASLHIEDGNDDGEVTINFNSWLAGRDDDTALSQIGGQAESGTDRANATLQNATSLEDNQDNLLSAVMLNQSGPTVGTTTGNGNGITGPMDPEAYDINITEAVADPTDLGDAQEYGVGTLQVLDPSVDATQTWVLPDSEFTNLDEDEPQEIWEYVENEELTQSSQIAEGDTIVFRIESDGMFGPLEIQESASGNNYADAFQALVQTNVTTGFTTNLGLANQYDFTVEQQNEGANRDPKYVDWQSTNGNNGMVVIPDQANRSLFVAIDEDQTDLFRDSSAPVGFNSNTQSGTGTHEFSSGDEYEANWTLRASSGLVDEGTSGTDTFDITSKSIDFDTNDNDVIRVEQAADQVISGSTSVAPGTDLTLNVRSRGANPFLETPEATVQADRTFNATVDFSDRAVDTQFSVNGRTFDSDYQTPGVVGEAPTASVSIDNQSVSADGTVTVDTTVSDGGFMAIHQGTAGGEVIGTSDYLEPGEHTVEVELDTDITEEQTLVAMPHLDTDDNQTYGFEGGTTDSPYTNNDGQPVTDSAMVSPADDGGTETTQTTEPGMETTEPDMETTTEEPSGDDTGGDDTGGQDTDTPESDGDGAGFTAAIALIALIAAALLAVRRRA